MNRHYQFQTAFEVYNIISVHRVLSHRVKVLKS